MLIIKHIFIIYIYKYCKIRLSLKTKQKINNHLKPKMIKKIEFIVTSHTINTK